MNNNTYGTNEYYEYELEKAKVHMKLMEIAVETEIKNEVIRFENICLYAEIVEDVRYRHQEAQKAYQAAIQREEE